MIDDFGFSHRRIQLDRRPYVLPAHLFHNDLRVLREMEVPWRWVSLLDITSLARVFVSHFNIVVNEMLLRIHAGRLIDQQLLEVVALHRLQVKYMSERIPHPRIGRCVPILGAMIQQRLSLVLASISHTQHQALFDLGKSDGYHKVEWENAFVGAAACARTIMAFCSIEGCEVLLSSEHEDVDLGIDLFVRRGAVNLACGVKSGLPNTGLYAAILAEMPEQGSPTFQERRSLFAGTTKYNQNNRADFVPVYIRVGRVNRERYDLTVYEADWRRLERLMRCVSRMQDMSTEPAQQTLLSRRSS